MIRRLKVGVEKPGIGAGQYRGENTERVPGEFGRLGGAKCRRDNGNGGVGEPEVVVADRKHTESAEDGGYVT